MQKLGAETIPWENRDRVDFDILVNATKIGMSPEEELPNGRLIFERDLSGITVFDAVYSPIDTRLLTLSKTRGKNSKWIRYVHWTSNGTI